MEQCDIAIVGAGMVGAATACLLAAQGLSVRVIETRLPEQYAPEQPLDLRVSAISQASVALLEQAGAWQQSPHFCYFGPPLHDLAGKRLGLIGSGVLGQAMARLGQALGMEVCFAARRYGTVNHNGLGFHQTSGGCEERLPRLPFDELLASSDVISLHCPLTDENYHLLNRGAFDQMKDGVMVINTSRGALIDSQAAIDALKNQKIGSLGMDVYENERDLFFEDKSNDVIQDDVFRRLSACHNVLFTGHQAFLTAEALISISETTLGNLQQVANGETCPNAIV